MNRTNTVTFTTLKVTLLIAGGLMALVVPQLIHQQKQLALADKGGIPNFHASDKARGQCIGICAEQPGTLVVVLGECDFVGPGGRCPVNSFQITVTGNNPVPSTFVLVTGESRPVTLGAGNYKVTVQPSSSLPVGDSMNAVFEGDCRLTLGKPPTATGTIAGGQSQRCAIILHWL